MKIMQLEQPITRKAICLNKHHWIDMMVYGKCSTCKKDWESRDKNALTIN